MSTIIVTGGSPDGSIPNEFWYEDDNKKKHGPFRTLKEATEENRGELTEVSVEGYAILEGPLVIGIE